MKLHLCCGDIYLFGYTNIDKVGCLVDGDTVDVAPTDLAHYYQNRVIGAPRTVFIDRQMDVTVFPWEFDDRSIDEIVMIQSIEHFTTGIARQIMHEVKRVLKSGGHFLVDFPDVMETTGLAPNLCMRLLYGSERNPHLWGYTRETFRELLGSGWWWVEFREIVKHDYPVIGCEAVMI